MYGQQYHETKSLPQLGAGVQAQTALGEINQRLSSATVRVGDVNVRLKDIHGKVFGNSPEAVEKQGERPTAHSALCEIQNMFELLERRISELEVRAGELNKII